MPHDATTFADYVREYSKWRRAVQILSVVYLRQWVHRWYQRVRGCTGIIQEYTSAFWTSCAEWASLQKERKLGVVTSEFCNVGQCWFTSWRDTLARTRVTEYSQRCWNRVDSPHYYTTTKPNHGSTVLLAAAHCKQEHGLVKCVAP